MSEQKIVNLISGRFLVVSEKPFVMGKSQNMHKYNISFSINTAKKDEPAKWATTYMSLIVTEANDFFSKGDQIHIIDGQLSLSKYTKKDGTEVTELTIWSNSEGVQFLKHIELGNKVNSVNDEEDDSDTEDDIF